MFRDTSTLVVTDTECAILRAGLINYINEIRGIEEQDSIPPPKTKEEKETKIQKHKTNDRKLQWLEIRTPIAQMGLKENPWVYDNDSPYERVSNYY